MERYPKTVSGKPVITIDKITIEIGYDDTVDPEQAFDDPQDIAEAKAGKIFPMYVKAEAEVSYPVGQGSRRIEWLSSSGLYGIWVSDTNDPYLKENADEQVADLKDHLKVFGITGSMPKPVIKYK